MKIAKFGGGRGKVMKGVSEQEKMPEGNGKGSDLLPG